jgi:dihydrofolate synthase/folylpolyglutamate synthase
VIETWQQALDDIYGRANFETRPPGTPHTFELDRIRRLLARLGDPQRRFPAVHVGGTNGKGSTCAYVASILKASGYRVGLYTSPHMHTVRERVRINGRLIEEEAVVEWLNRHRAALEAEPELTTFEVLTALAFYTFAGQGVDIAVVEVGLGGTLDTTNVVESAVSVVTPVALDHTKLLGDTVEVIARDKAGIFREGVPVVLGPQSPAARAVLEDAARGAGCPLIVVDAVGRWTRGTDGLAVVLDLPDEPSPREFRLPALLAGPHQEGNAVTAVAAAVALERQGWRIPRRAIETGVAETRWPGRFEVLPDPAVPGAPIMVVDGAHNPHAAAALALALAGSYPDRALHLVLGFGREKDAAGIIGAVAPLAASITTTAAPHPKALDPDEAADLVRADGFAAEPRTGPADALAHVLELAGASDVVVATGSIFVAAAMREAWLRRWGLPMPPSDGPPPQTRTGKPR